jgi:hypothetical protein
MAESTGFVLAAGGIVALNDLLTAMQTANKKGGNPDWWDAINWRILPATAVMAGVLAGIESMAPAFGKGLGMLVLLSVLVVPVGNASTPLTNLSTVLGYG